jgi:hypothetical protein
MEPSELLEYDSRLVGFMQELPFHEGKPLYHITGEEEGSTELVEYSHTAETSSDMASLRNTEDNEPGPEYDAKLLMDVSADERTADAPQDENEEQKEDPMVEERQARQVQAEHGKPRTQPAVPQEPQQCLRSGRRSGVLHPDRRHYKGNAPSSTTTAKPSGAKTAVPNPARARATR